MRPIRPRCRRPAPSVGIAIASAAALLLALPISASQDGSDTVLDEPPASAAAPSPPASPAFAQERRAAPDAPVIVRARGAAGIAPGSRFEIVVEAEVDRGWHIYGMKLNEELGIPTKLVASDLGPFRAAGEAIEPAPRSHFDATLGGTMLEHEGKVPFRLPLEAPAELARGRYAVTVVFTYQVCSNVCLMPETLTFTLPVWVGEERPPGDGGGAEPANGGANGGADGGAEGVADGGSAPVAFEARLDRTQLRPGEPVLLSFEGEVRTPGLRIPAIEQDLSRQGLWAIIVLSVGGALFALLTPCVYPMIPITISVFTKQAHKKRSAVVGLALLFCVGVMASFTALGLGLSVILGEQGANFMATNPWVNLAIGALFVYFAFSLFGYYDIQLPAFLRNRAASGGSGIASVLIMGLVFSITTFTCVGPIAAALLALAAGAGPGYAAVGMLAFSATFALPFFLLALFPKALAGLPRSGGWLSTVKGILGFIEIIAAWKFFSATIGRFGLDSVISREVIYAIWGLLLVAMALYLLGRFRFPHDSPLEKIGAPRVLLSLAFLLLAGFCGWAVAGRTWNANLESQLLVKSFYATESEAAWRELSHENPVPWEEALAELDARIAAGGERKPILINFTGHV